MSSESARMSTAAEARYRIDAPNALPRHVTVIALDAASVPVVEQLSRMEWSRATFLTASAFTAPHKAQKFSVSGWLSDLAGRTTDLLAEVARADLVVMIATAGQSATAAALIGEACRARHVMTTALLIGGANSGAADTLAQLRPHARMLVTASSVDYVEDMLIALRA